VTTAKKMPLQIIVEANDKASAKLSRIQAVVARMRQPLDRLRGALRMTGIPQALSRVTDFAAGMGRTFISAGSKVAAFGAVAATAIGAVVQRVTRAGDQTIKFSRQIGLNVERLQEWRYAAEQAGIPAESFDKALAKLGLRASQARAGVGEARDYFRALGISMTDAAGNVRDIESLLPEIADKIQAITDPNARGVFLGKFFDDEGVALARMLDRGSEGLEDMARQARELGAVASAETLGGFEEFQGTVGRLTAQFKGLTTELVAKLVPAIQTVAGQFSAWLTENQGQFREWAEWLGTHLPYAMERVGANLEALWKRLEPVVSAVGGAIRNADRLGQLLGFTKVDDPYVREFREILGFTGKASTESKAEASRMRSESARARRATGGLSDVGDVNPPAARAAAEGAALAGSLLVRFAGAPSGTRVEMDRAARRMVDLSVGYAMPGVGGR